MRPRKGNGRSGQNGRETPLNKHDPSAHAHHAQRRGPFVVEIECFGRRKEWGRFASAADADREIAKLRRIGFHAERSIVDAVPR